MIVRFAGEAERDLEEIGDHIAIDDPYVALWFVRALRDRCMALAISRTLFPCSSAMRQRDCAAASMAIT